MFFKQFVGAGLALLTGSAVAQLGILEDLLEQPSASTTTIPSSATPSAPRHAPEEEHLFKRNNVLAGAWKELNDGTSQGLKRSPDVLETLLEEVLPQLAQSSSASMTPSSATAIPTPFQWPTGFPFKKRDSTRVVKRQLEMLDDILDELVPELAQSISTPVTSPTSTPSVTPAPTPAKHGSKTLGRKPDLLGNLLDEVLPELVQTPSSWLPSSVTATPSPSHTPWSPVPNAEDSPASTFTGPAKHEKVKSSKMLDRVQSLVERDADLLGELLGGLVPEFEGSSSSSATPAPSASAAFKPVPHTTFQVRPSGEKVVKDGPAPSEPAILDERQISSTLLKNINPKGELPPYHPGN